MNRTRAYLAISAALLVLVAACGGTASPGPAASSSSSPSSTAAAAATKPPRATVKVSVGSAASLLYLPALLVLLALDKS